MNPQRAAIFGMGGFARLHHDSLKILESEGVAKLVATCDLHPEAFPDRLAELEARGVKIYRDWREMLQDHAGELDFACVPTPIPLHAPMHRAAIEAGAAVYLEKPPTLDPRELEQMLEMEKRAPFASAVGFNFIGEIARQNLKARLVSGEFGRLERAGFLGHWPRAESYFRRAAWAGRLRDASGHLILDSCVGNALAHYVHNLLFWCGDQKGSWGAVETLEAALFRAHDIESFDTVFARGQSQSKTGEIEVVMAATHAGSGGAWQTEWLECEKARISYLTRDGWTIEWRDGRLETGPSDDFSVAGLLTRNLHQFLRTLNGQEDKPLSTLEDSRPFVDLNALLFVAARQIQTLAPSEFQLVVDEGGETFRAIPNIEAALQNFAQTGQFPAWAKSKTGRATRADLPKLESVVDEILARQ